MNGQIMRAIRGELAMSREEFARFLGYTGNWKNNKNRIGKFESGRAQIPLPTARLVWLVHMLNLHHGYLPERYRDQNGQIIWPDWPGYDYESVPDPVHQKEPA
jgi:transcriptional regulator with XRE-family HTH domain